MPSKKSSWSSAQRKKFRETMARKRQVTSIPIEMLPDKPIRRQQAPKASLEQAKLQLAHEVLQVLMKVLS